MILKMPEFVENPEARCPVMLALDSSQSMAGAPMRELLAGIQTFRNAIQEDELASLRVEFAITTFGAETKLIQDFTTLDGFTAPTIKAEGKTPLGGGLNLALDHLDARKSTYKRFGIPYYRPWLFLISDGAPTDGLRWQEAAMRAQEADLMNKLAFFVVGVDGADMDILTDIAPAHRAPMMLRGLAFTELFRWLSASVRRVSTSYVGAQSIALPSIEGWAAAPA